MPDDDAKANGDPAKDGGNTPKPAKKKRRRKPRRRKPNTPKKDEGLATPDLAVAEQATEDALDKPSEAVQEAEAAKVASSEQDAGSAEPSPFDLAASFDAPASGDPSPAPTPEPPAPEPTPTPEPKPESSAEPSPFDLAKDEPASGPADSFGDYESPFNSPSGESGPDKPAEDKPAEPAESPFSEPSTPEPPAPEPEPVASSEPSPFDMAPGEGPVSEPQIKSDEPKEEPKDEPFEAAAPSPQVDEPIADDPFGDESPGEPAPEEAPAPEAVEGEIMGQEDPFASPGDPEAPVEEAVGEMAMEGSLMDRLQQMLEEANLTTRHLKFCCGGVVLIVVIILVAFFIAPKLLSGDLFDGRDKDKDQDVVVEDTVETDTEDVEVDTEEVVSGGPVWVDPSIYSGLILGDPNAELEGDTGIESGVLVGDEEETMTHLSEFQTYVEDLEDIYNMYFVDLFDLLDNSTNRTETLDTHIQELKDHYNLGVDNYDAIQATEAELTALFNEGELEKEAMEIQFFEELNAFEATEAEGTLLDFIALKQSQTDLKAKYYVFVNLESKYEAVLSSMYDRVQDIENNREALIAGVQVVDFEGSDLDLILTEDDLEE